VRSALSPILLAAALLTAAPHSPAGGEAGDAAPKFLGGEERDAFLARIEKRMTAIQSVAAAFTQEKTLRVFKHTVRSSGVILFRRPDRLRWEICEPFRSILVASGDRAGKFEYAGGERRRLRLADGGQAVTLVMTQVRSWFRGKFEDRRGYYAVDVAAEPAPLIVLRPRAAALKKSIEKIEVELTGDLSAVKRLRIVERQGDSTRMRFREIRRDAAIPEDFFAVADPCELDLERIKNAPASSARETP
jgi:outer membrane lipoprotein-sorting protein